MNHEINGAVYFEKYRAKRSISDVVKNVIKMKKKRCAHSRTDYKIIFYLKEEKTNMRKRDNEKNKDGVIESGR